MHASLLLGQNVISMSARMGLEVYAFTPEGLPTVQYFRMSTEAEERALDAAARQLKAYLDSLNLTSEISRPSQSTKNRYPPGAQTGGAPKV